MGMSDGGELRDERKSQHCGKLIVAARPLAPAKEGGVGTDDSQVMRALIIIKCELLSSTPFATRSA